MTPLEVGGNDVASSHVVTSPSSLQEVVAAIQASGTFVFDVETRGHIDRHAEVVDLIAEEWKHKKQTLKSDNADVIARSYKAIEDRWRKSLALDTLRNEVFWIGIAVEGRSWAIPMGHNHGDVLVPEERGDGTTIPPPGYRAVLPSGKESLARAKYLVPAIYSDPPPQLTQEEVFDALYDVFMDEAIVKVGHNVKFDAKSVSKYLGGQLPKGKLIDTQILQHICNENMINYRLTSLIEDRFGGIKPYDRHGKIGAIIDEVSFSAACRYVHQDVRWTWLLFTDLWAAVSADAKLYKAACLDIDVTPCLAQMEMNGILVNQREMVKLGKRLDLDLQKLLADLAQYAPPGFNPDANQHKADLLFNKKRDGGLGLKPVKTTPGGKPSVDASVLKTLENKHPAVAMLTDWAELKKLKSTYVDGMRPLLHHGRLHPQFHLHRTATGRLSSSDPNLQNIPRDEDVRGLFIAEPGNTLVVADYDQIELRLLAAFSKDKEMYRIFTEGIDVHAATAGLILGKDPEDVSGEERTVYGKVPNFLMGYGGGPMRLVEATNGVLTVTEAKSVIDQYNAAYSGLTAWKYQIYAFGKRHGYVETLTGRRRRLPDLKSHDFGDRARAERQAVNAVIQGTAAEICKRAMIDVSSVLEEGTKMLVQVHDELVISTPSNQARTWERKLEQAMGNGRILGGIPILVTAHSAGSWSEAKG